MKARIVDAGTKYLAISFCSLSAAAVFGRTVIFRLMMPSKHFCPASNTPDPEFPVVATSLITVENLFWTLAGSNDGNIMVRARRSFGNRDDERFPGPRLVVTQCHAVHPQIDRELVIVYGKERQIHSLEIALPNGGRGQLHASDVHARLGVGG